MKKLIILLIVILMIASCNKETSTSYEAIIVNTFDKNLYVEIESVTQPDTLIIIEPAMSEIIEQKSYLTAFQYQYSVGYQPELKPWEFKSLFKTLSIFYINGSDTIYLNSDLNYFMNIDLWEYEREIDNFMGNEMVMYNYRLTISK